MSLNPYESPQGLEAPKVSGARSIFGWIFIGIGTLLTLRCVWLSWWWWPLREVEVNRLVVLSSLGILLAFVGGWLRFRNLLFLGVPILIAILLVLLLLFA